MSLTAEPDESVAAPAAARRRFSMPAEDLAWVGSICGAIVVALACWKLAPQLARLYPEPVHDVFSLWRTTVLPEPLEETRSILALGTPFVVAAAIIAFGTPGAPSRSLNRLIVPAQAAAIVLLVAAVLKQPRQSGFLIDYFQPYLLSVPNLVAGVVIGILLTVGTLRWSGRLPEAISRSASRLKGGSALPLGIAVVATAVFLLPAVVTDATVGHAGPLASGHIPVQAEDYLAAVNGRTPLVDYIAQYANLLPLLLEPVLKTFHSSLTSVSIALCTLSAIALLSIFGVFRVVTRGSWTALALFLPFLALALFPWNDNGPYRNFDANYYGILPGRLLGPFVLAWLCAVSTRRRIPTWALFGFGGLVSINNIEFGLPALLALLAATAMGSERVRLDPRRLGRFAVEAAAGLVGAVVIVCAVILLRAGELPNPTLLTYFNRLFLRDSFGLVPMPTLGLHWALYATYVGGAAAGGGPLRPRPSRSHPDRHARVRRHVRAGNRHVLRRPVLPVPADAAVPSVGVRARTGGVGRPALAEEGEGEAGGPGAIAAARLRGPDRIRNDDLRTRPRLAALEADRSPLDGRPRSE